MRSRRMVKSNGVLVYEGTGGATVATTIHQQPKESTVAKGLEQKKETKKKPAKTMKEKKAAKTAKKAGK